MSDAPPDRTGSREQRALRKSAAIFRAAVDPSSIISALHDEQLLTSQEWNKARHQMLTTDERVDVVWEALMRRAAVDPSVFHLVVKILRNVPAMKKLGDQMQKLFEEEGGTGITSADQPAERSAGRGGATPNPQPVPDSHTPAQQTPSPASSRPECTQDEAALLRAAASGDVGAVERLLLNGCVNINCTDQDGATAIFVASREGHVTIVQHLIARGGNVNISMKDGWTPLMRASYCGHTDVVQALLVADVNINQQENNGATALYIASEKGNSEIVKLLLAKGAAVDLCEEEGCTALYIASQFGHKKVVQLLLSGGAKINNDSFKTCHTALIIASEEGQFEVVKLLLERGADINISTNDGATALFVASQNGHKEVVRLLLKNNANVSIRRKSGDTAIDKARSKGHREIVQLLEQ